MSLEKRIERLLLHSGGEWALSDFMELIYSSKIQLFDYQGILILTEVQIFPQKRILHVWGVEGDSALEKLPEIVDWVKELARALDCVELRCQGRKGWERALHSQGASVLYTTLSMDV